MGRHRQADRDLAVVLLAQLAAILPRHADRVAALLGKACVVDDPRLDRFVTRDGWQDTVRAHGATSPDRTTAPGPQSAAAIDVAPRFAPARSLPPMVRRSCGPPPTAARYSSPRMASHGQHGPAPMPNLPCILETRLRAGSIVKIHPTLPGRLESSLDNKSHSRRSKRKLPVGLVVLQLSRISERDHQSRNAPSATVSSAYSGTLTTGVPRRTAAGMSIESTPTPYFTMPFSFAAASITLAVIGV